MVTRDPKGHIDDRAYFSTLDELPPERILEQFARRWEIEVAFRNAKQSLGLQDPQNGWWRRRKGSPKPKKKPGPNADDVRGHQAAEHTFALALAAFFKWSVTPSIPAERWFETCPAECPTRARCP